MLTSVAFVVCQVRVVDWPWLIVFGFADSEAVGAGGGGGGGGGGGATFLWHAPRNMIVPSANTRVAHLAVVVVILIACFTDSSCFCAPALWRAIYRFTAGRTLGQPQSRSFFETEFSKPVFQKQSTSNSS
jgi:hypothetical protein